MWGSVMFFVLGFVFKHSAYLLLWEDLGGPEKDLYISNCPERTFYSSGPEKDLL